MDGQAFQFLHDSLARMALGGQRFLPDTLLHELRAAPALADVVAKVVRARWQSAAWRRNYAGALVNSESCAEVIVSCLVPIPVRRADYLPTARPFNPIPQVDSVRADVYATNPENGAAVWGAWCASDSTAEAEGNRAMRLPIAPEDNRHARRARWESGARPLPMPEDCETESADFADFATRRFGTGNQSRIDVKYQRAARNSADVDIADARDTLEFTLAELTAAHKRKADAPTIQKLGALIGQAAQELREAIDKRAQIVGPQRYKRGAARRAWLQVQYETGIAVMADRAPLVTIPDHRSAWHRAAWCARFNRRALANLGAPQLAIGLRALAINPLDVSPEQSDMGRLEAYARYLNRVRDGRGRMNRQRAARFNVTTREDRQRQSAARSAREVKLAALAALVDSGRATEARRMIGIS